MKIESFLKEKGRDVVKAHVGNLKTELHYLKGLYAGYLPGLGRYSKALCLI
ncbi:hypothetical protein BMS3Abin07_02191 [bacterium BMS3Abin07]|nr:hypothetical protein BMS3Abin07_02191 [bacterium BMS3Abin07]